MLSASELTPQKYHTSQLCENYGHPISMRKASPDIVAKTDLFVDSGCAYRQGDTSPLPVWTNPVEQAEWVRAQLEAQGIIFASGKR